jgi:hypothetical protein
MGAGPLKLVMGFVTRIAAPPNAATMQAIASTVPILTVPDRYKGNACIHPTSAAVLLASLAKGVNSATTASCAPAMVAVSSAADWSLSTASAIQDGQAFIAMCMTSYSANTASSMARIATACLGGEASFATFA